MSRRVPCHPFPAPEERAAGSISGDLSFQAHVDLLDSFLTHRDGIVGKCQAILNAQRKPVEYLQDAARLSREIEDCFFASNAVPPDRSHLRGQLEAAHRATGFRPREMPEVHNGLIDPAEILTRAFYLWRQTRWPGRNGRIGYAHTLFNLSVIRSLELLSLRLWDGGPSSASDRLACLQRILDRLWAATPPGQPVLVRDARWLIQLAQSPATDDLGVYFEMAARIADSFSRDDRIEIHKAGVRMVGGHLRSQIRYYSLKRRVPIDDLSVVLSTRTSNALDFALLIQELVPLLDAYEQAVQRDDRQQRLDLADAICQGVSPDPELFVNQVALLGAYSMIQHLFTAADDDRHAMYTAMGCRHVALLAEYDARIGRVSKWLYEDCSRFAPVAGTYSPYGVMYGFSSHLMEHIALKASQADATTQFVLEDVFAGGGADKLAWVNGWRNLPHLTAEARAQFEYPQQFAEQVFDRLQNALRTRAADTRPSNGFPGRIFIVSADDAEKLASIPDVPVRYIASSDEELVAAGKAQYADERHLASDRREGRSVIGYDTAGGSVAISKAMLTAVLGKGQDVKIVGLPAAAAALLPLLCPRLVVPAQDTSAWPPVARASN